MIWGFWVCRQAWAPYVIIWQTCKIAKRYWQLSIPQPAVKVYSTIQYAAAWIAACHCYTAQQTLCMCMCM